MPFIDELKTLREKAGLRKSELAKAADLSPDTVTRIEKHKNASAATLTRIVNALNTLHYAKAGREISADRVISQASKFGEGQDNVRQMKKREART